MSHSRVALVHDWLTGMRGGEKVLEALCEILPNADIFTLLHIPGSVSKVIEARAIHTSFIQTLPGAHKLYRHFLPLMPLAIGRLNVQDYDVVISSSHCVAKGIRKRPGAIHLCYCHTPMRYIWDQYDQYFGPGRAHPAVRLAMSALRPFLQRWDLASNSDVDHFIANSCHVAKRIQRLYGRTAEVLYPPVETDRFAPSGKPSQDYYLAVGAMAPYKRLDLAIETCNRLKRKLIVAGDGQDRSRLLKLAGPTITFLPWQSDEQLRSLYQNCRALLFPGEEDFGIVPVEVQACGRPVIAYGVGGATETVLEGRTGVLFKEQSVHSLSDAILQFERASWNPEPMRANAAAFDKSRFQRDFLGLLSKTIGHVPD